jgi:threonine aldolase
VAGAINDPEFYHSPLTSLVCVENTTNKGGACYELEDLQRIKQVCDANNLKFHLMVRIWNALVAKSKIRRHLESYLILFLFVYLKG